MVGQPRDIFPRVLCKPNVAHQLTRLMINPKSDGYTLYIVGFYISNHLVSGNINNSNLGGGGLPSEPTEAVRQATSLIIKASGVGRDNVCRTGEQDSLSNIANV